MTMGNDFNIEGQSIVTIQEFERIDPRHDDKSWLSMTYRDHRHKYD